MIIQPQYCDSCDTKLIVGIAGETDSDANGKTFNALPGQKIHLGISDSSVTDVKWSVPGDTFKSYIVNSSTGTLDDTPLKLSEKQLDFYYLKGTNSAIKVTFRKNGRPCRLSVTIKVEVVKLDAQNSTIGRVSEFPGPCTINGVYGDAIGFLYADGLDTYASAKASKGEFVFAQLIKYVRTITRPSRIEEILRVGLDTRFPTCSEDSPDCKYSVNQMGHFHDDPYSCIVNLSQALESGQVRSIERKDELQLYLLYLPPGPGSTYVPVGRLEWNWSFKVTNGPTITGNQHAGSWHSTNEHPQWTEVVSEFN